MASAKVLTFDEFRHTPGFREGFSQLIAIVPWRVLKDGTKLAAPRFNTGMKADYKNPPFQAPLLLDFTPGEDTWLRAQAGVDYVGQLKKHHAAAETVACKVLLELPTELAKDVSDLDMAIMHVALKPGETKSRETGLNWVPMMRTETTMLVNIVLDGSDAPTQLCFIGDDGAVQTGAGLEFFKTQLGDNKIEDFSCKVWAEMQFIDVQTELHRKSVAVKVHSMALAKTPKEKVVSFTQNHIDSFVRAAKRIRVNRL